MAVFFLALVMAIALPAGAVGVKTVTAIDPKTKKKITLRGNFQLRKADSTSSTSYGNVAKQTSTIELTGKRNKTGDWLEVKVAGTRRWIKIDSVVNKSALRPVAMASAPLPPKRPSDLSVTPTVPLPPQRPSELAGNGTQTPSVDGSSTTTPAQPPARPQGRRLPPRTASRMEAAANGESKANPAADAPVAAPAAPVSPAATTSAAPSGATSSAATSGGESLATSAARSRSTAAAAPKSEAKTEPKTEPKTETRIEQKTDLTQKPVDSDCIKDSSEYEKNARFKAAMPDPYQSKWSGGWGQIQLQPDGKGQLEVVLGKWAKPKVQQLYAEGKIPGPMKGEGDKEPYPMEVCLREGKNAIVKVMGSEFEMNDPKGTSFDSKLDDSGTTIKRVVQ